MVKIGDIPAEVRWMLANRAASAMPVIYNKELGGNGEQEYSEIEREVWTETGREARLLAQSFGLGLDTALHVAEIFGVISAAIFGPEFQVKAIEGSTESATLKIEGCPCLCRAQEMGVDPWPLYTPCLAYSTFTVQGIDPDYRVSISAALCKGDRYCEVFIERQYYGKQIRTFGVVPNRVAEKSSG